VRNDVRAYGMRWVTIGPPSQPDINIVLEPPAADPGISPSDREAIGDLLAKGLLRGLNFKTADLDAIFDRVQATGAEVVQEPMDQSYGRDCAFRDPAGNMIRILQTRG
jgi:catechol 2,3-dioxygenase-like lactoylglutathione lyase family enzyme